MTPLILVLCVASLTTLASGHPPMCPYCPEAVKKDIFMSRGWGAGGLPFMNPKKSPSRTPEEPSSVEEEPEVGEPSAQYLMARRHPIPPERHASAVPQLFVSYGWGPLGK